jgi:hypothetical protein
MVGDVYTLIDEPRFDLLTLSNEWCYFELFNG